MALYTMVSEKLYLGSYYSNRYIIQADTLLAAIDIASDIRTIEREVHYDTVQFTKYRVSDQVEGTDVYQIISDNVNGVLVQGGSEALPKFCRIRVDFNTDGGGRPSRKYLLTPLLEPDTANGMLTSGKRSYVQANYVVPLVALTGFVDVDGQAFGSGSVMAEVGMHQMRRGSKRKALPIIP